MRKALGIVTILLMVSVLVLSVKEDRTASEQTQTDYGIDEQIKTLQGQLKEEYPHTPKEVIDYYNSVLAIQYNEGISKEAISETITLARSVYSKALTQLVPYREQVEEFETEYMNGSTDENNYKAATIKAITFEEDGRVYVEVLYELTKEQFERTYELVSEDEKWCINKWEDKKPNE